MYIYRLRMSNCPPVGKVRFSSGKYFVMFAAKALEKRLIEHRTFSVDRRCFRKCTVRRANE